MKLLNSFNIFYIYYLDDSGSGKAQVRLDSKGAKKYRKKYWKSLLS